MIRSFATLWKRVAIFSLAILPWLPVSLDAQSLYSSAVSINGQNVTYFEIDQRARLMQALGAPEEVVSAAKKTLTEDRLREFAARNMGLTVTAEELAAAMTEFAKPAKLTADQFVAELENSGVYRESFEDFVRTGLLWRKVVQTRFQSKAVITDAELETAMALGTTAVGTTVLVSELIIPILPGSENDTMELAKMLAGRIHGFAEFEEAVLTYSASPSRANGGKLDWMPAANLPPAVAQSITSLGIGSVTAPVRLPNAVVMFQIRGIRDNRSVAARTIAYDYATLLMPGGRSAETLAKAETLAGSIDTCNDLQAKSAKFGTFERKVVPVGKTSRRIAGELGALDANEVSFNLSAGENDQYLMFLMLCARTNRLSQGNREQVRLSLLNQRMEAFGNGYLQELMGDAIISEP